MGDLDWSEQRRGPFPHGHAQPNEEEEDADDGQNQHIRRVEDREDVAEETRADERPHGRQEALDVSGCREESERCLRGELDERSKSLLG